MLGGYRKEERALKSTNRLKYTDDMPRRLYTYFVTFNETSQAPSFQKFARSIGGTLEDVERFRKHKKFERAYRECNEIRRDYLIDNALTRRFDPSTVKFILADEYKAGEEAPTGTVSVTLEVVE